jgi:hypothetical protein
LFNGDDRAAELNLGSFRKISTEIRAQVNVEFQRWILNHITARRSFAIETTLCSPISFEQSRLACDMASGLHTIIGSGAVIENGIRDGRRR